MQYLPDGLVLAVVDPGVGTDRRAVAVETESGILLGPDNGLLAPAVAMIGGATRVISLTNEEYQLAAPGPTFAGRDVLAPAAGFLASGVALGELGDEIDPVSLTPGLVPLPNVEHGTLVGEVWWVDRYGNCQLNVDPDELGQLGVRPGAHLEVRFGVHRARRRDGCTPTRTPSRRSSCCSSTRTGCSRSRSTGSPPRSTAGCAPARRSRSCHPGVDA